MHNEAYLSPQAAVAGGADGFVQRAAAGSWDAEVLQAGHMDFLDWGPQGASGESEAPSGDFGAQASSVLHQRSQQRHVCLLVETISGTTVAQQWVRAYEDMIGASAGESDCWIAHLHMLHRPNCSHKLACCSTTRLPSDGSAQQGMPRPLPARVHAYGLLGAQCADGAMLRSGRVRDPVPGDRAPAGRAAGRAARRGRVRGVARTGRQHRRILASERHCSVRM